MIRNATVEQREHVDQQLTAPLRTVSGAVQPATPFTEEEEGETFMNLLRQVGD